jgi:hypothetical protein
MVSLQCMHARQACINCFLLRCLSRLKAPKSCGRRVLSWWAQLACLHAVVAAAATAIQQPAAGTAAAAAAAPVVALLLCCCCFAAAAAAAAAEMRR